MSELIPSSGPNAVPGPAAAPPSAGGIAELDPAPPGNAIELREIIAVLRRHARLILVTTAVVFGVTGCLAIVERPQYRAAVMLRLKDARRSITGGLGGAAADEMLGQRTDPVLSLIEVLRSRTVADSAVSMTTLRLESRTRGFAASSLERVRVAPEAPPDTLALRFAEDGYEITARRAPAVRAAYGAPVNVGGVRFTLAVPPGVKEATLIVRPRDPVVVQLQQELGAQVRKETDVVDVSYVSSDPVVAEQVANATVAAFRDLTAYAARATSRQRRIFIEEQLAQTDSLLVGVQLGLSQFRRREAVYSSREKFAAQQVGLMGLEVRREELDSERRMSESLLASLEHEGGLERAEVRTLVSAPGIAANTVVTQLYAQLVRYELVRDSLTAGVWGKTTTNPEVQRFESLIRSTKAELLQAIRGHIAALEARVAALDDLKARSAAELRTLPGVEAEEARIVQQVETIRRLADQLREEYQKARIAEAVATGQVEIVEWAERPSIPIGSKRLLKLSLGLVLGLLLGAGTAFLLENLDTAIRRRDELESVLGVSGLATIPRLGGGNGRPLLPRLAALRNGQHKFSGPGRRGRRPVTISHPGASASEAYRTLRTNLIFSQSARAHRTLVVTSASPSEGKTTTAVNLAIAFAQQGVRVLLVDCDLRRPRIDQIFGIACEPGLFALAVEEERTEVVIRETEVEGLFVLPAGVVPPNPGELLGGAAMRRLLDRLSDAYDLVILDTPPVLLAGDASILAAGADGVLFVVRAGETDREAARAALQQLGTVGARIVGAILNDPDGEVPRYTGYYRKYAGYGAGS